MNHPPNGTHSSRARSLVAAAALLAGVVLLPGCNDIFGSSDPQPTIQAIVAEEEPRATAVTGGAGFLRFEGNITTETRCQDLRAKLDRFSESNGVIELRIEASALDPCPDERETVWNYLGSLQAVEPGVYSVTVEHRFQNQDRASKVVFEGQAEIVPR